MARGLLAALALLAAGCDRPESDALVIHAQPYIKEVYAQVVADYGSAHPDVSVRFEPGPRDEEQMVQQLLRSSLIGAPLPDVVMVSGNFVRLLAERELAVPLGAFIAGHPHWRTTVAEAVIEAGRYGRSSYGLAFGFSVPVVLFNKQLVRRAGADPEHLPTDWPQILALAKRIDDSAEGVVGGLLEYDGGGAFAFLALLESHGGTLLSGDEREVAVDTVAGLQALDVVRGFGLAGQARADMSRDQARQAFGAGSVGVFVTMSSMLPRLEQAAEGYFEIGMAPFPMQAQGRLPTAGPVAVMLTRDPARQRRVFALMSYLTSAEAQIAMAKASGYVPANSLAIAQSAALRGLLEERSFSAAVLGRLDAATRWYAPPGPNAIRIADRITTRMQQVVTLEQEPAAALRQLVDEIRPLLPDPTS
ncbi:extracellular solute-binding protein [Steroidobacter sp. S1-65]|uniref:Extracellular solute-binding protein n=1 Tax=Steroidobacter gossypii TaxID=2805490 RepID=A0ABS1WY96_9GAMM|nr:extracellular solute-binding protein [Steroidobacter gossypii]MBM0105954.1 extracellular solute-binding protein [Steroidobacter gossypii]